MFFPLKWTKDQNSNLTWFHGGPKLMPPSLTPIGFSCDRHSQSAYYELDQSSREMLLSEEPKCISIIL